MCNICYKVCYAWAPPRVETGHIMRKGPSLLSLFCCFFKKKKKKNPFGLFSFFVVFSLFFILFYLFVCVMNTDDLPPWRDTRRSFVTPPVPRAAALTVPTNQKNQNFVGKKKGEEEEEEKNYQIP